MPLQGTRALQGRIQHFYVNNSICEYPLSHDVFREVFFARLPKIITCLLTFSHLSDTVVI